MTSKGLVPPRIDEQVSGSKERLDAVERRLNLASGPPLPYVAKFSLWGPLVETDSGIEMHPRGGNLILVVANLVTAGSDETDLKIIKNGSTIEHLKFAADITHMRVPMATSFSAWGDTLQMGIQTAGTDAETITVHGLFDR